MYFPKSQVLTGLATNGSEFVVAATGESYKGPYWETSTGRFFTGPQPSAPDTQELLRPNENSIQADAPQDGEKVNIVTTETAYIIAKGITPTTVDKPQGITAAPTEQQYTAGEFRRYFCKSVNQELYLEISQETYSRLVNKDSTILWQYYTTFEMPWTLVGNQEQVFRTNKNITELTAKRNNAINLAQFLKNDYLKYYKG